MISDGLNLFNNKNIDFGHENMIPRNHPLNIHTSNLQSSKSLKEMSSVRSYPRDYGNHKGDKDHECERCPIYQYFFTPV